MKVVRRFRCRYRADNIRARIVSMDQFRGYTVAGMFLVNFVGGLAAFPEVLKHHNGLSVFQLCRHDHAQLHVRGRLFVSAERPAAVRQIGAVRAYWPFRGAKPGAGLDLAGDVCGVKTSNVKRWSHGL